MNRILISMLLVLTLLEMAASQTTIGPTNVMLLGIGTYTGATLQSRFPAANWPWYTAWVTDGPTCAGGGGGPAVLCYSNGTIWTPLSGGGPGGGVINNGSLTTGQPTYGNGGVTIQAVPTELAADTFPGADICTKIMAAEAALPTNGGVIRLSAQNYSPPCVTPITVNHKYVTIRGAGMGNFATPGSGSTVINFAAGISGIVGVYPNDENMVIEDVMILSASTVAGTDDGITLAGGSPRLSRVIVRGFGRNGVVFQNDTDFWRMENVYADHNKNDGFYFTPGCSDESAGFGTVLSATFSGNFGYDIECGIDNSFNTTHASNNTNGAWNITVNYNYFYNIYVEGNPAPANNFTFTSAANYNTATFTGYGQPNIIDNGVAGTNHIRYQGSSADGAYPAWTSFSLTGPPQQSAGVMYSLAAGSGSYGAQDLLFRDRTNQKNIWYYVPTTGWTFIRPVFIGAPGTIVPLTIQSSAGGTSAISSQATGGVTFSLPSNNGASGNCLLTDGAGNTRWSASCTGTGGPGGGPAAGPAGTIQASNGIGAFTAAAMVDNGTQITASETINAPTLTTGGTPPSGNCSPTGCWAMTEAAVAGTPTPGSGVDYCRADSTQHKILCSLNGAPESAIGGGTTAGANVMLKSDGSNIVASSMTDNATQVATTEPLNAGSLSTGATPPGGCSPTGCFALAETATPGTTTLGVDYCRADSATHGFVCSYNNGAEQPLGYFSGQRASTNTQALVMGTGGSLSTSGTGTIAATSLSAASALPNGTTATTQTPGDASNQVATDAFVAAIAAGSNPAQTSLVEYFCSGIATTGNIGNLAWSFNTIGAAPLVAGVAGTYPHRCILQLSTATAATARQGGSMDIAAGGSSAAGWGDFSTNTNWTVRATFSLQSTVSSVMRIGLGSQANLLNPPGFGIFFDANSPLSAAAVSTTTCTATTCTVTMAAAHGLIIPGQSITIAGMTCATHTPNATYPFGTATSITIPSTTTFTIPSTGSSGETCTGGTVTTNVMTNWAYIAETGSQATATTVDSGIAADTNWHTIAIYSTTPGTVQYKLDANAAVSISTNVTTQTLIPHIAVGTDITAQKSIQLNYWSYFETGLTR